MKSGTLSHITMHDDHAVQSHAFRYDKIKFWSQPAKAKDWQPSVESRISPYVAENMSFFLVRGCHRGRGRWVRWRRRRIWWISHDKPTSAFLHQKMLNKLALPDWVQEFLNSSITDGWVKVFGFMPKQIWHIHRTLANVMVSQRVVQKITPKSPFSPTHVFHASFCHWVDICSLDLGNLIAPKRLTSSSRFDAPFLCRAASGGV